jgi:hypothetical protein
LLTGLSLDPTTYIKDIKANREDKTSGQISYDSNIPVMLSNTTEHHTQLGYIGLAREYLKAVNSTNTGIISFPILEEEGFTKPTAEGKSRFTKSLTEL